MKTTNKLTRQHGQSPAMAITATPATLPQIRRHLRSAFLAGLIAFCLASGFGSSAGALTPQKYCEGLDINACEVLDIVASPFGFQIWASDAPNGRTFNENFLIKYCKNKMFKAVQVFRPSHTSKQEDVVYITGLSGNISPVYNLVQLNNGSLCSKIP